MDLEDFEDRLTSALVAQGVDENRIRITASTSQSYSSSGDGLQQMIDNFYVTPSGIEPPRILGETLIGPGPDKYIEDYDDPWKGLVSIHEYSGDVKIDAYSYVFCPAHGVLLFPKLEITNGIMRGYCVQLLCRFNGTSDRFDQVLGQPHEWPAAPCPDRSTYGLCARLLWVEGMRLDELIFYQNTLGHSTGQLEIVAESPYIVPPISNAVGHIFDGRPSWFDWVGVKVETKGTKIIVTTKDMPLIEYAMPESRKVTKGHVAYGLSLPAHGGLSGVSFEMGATTPLIDAVRSPSWSNNGQRFIIDVCDKPRKDFSAQPQLGELAERIKADDAYYLGWGTNASRSPIESFISRCNGQGIYLSSRAGDVYAQTAAYIEPIVNSRQPESGKTYLIKDNLYSFEQE